MTRTEAEQQAERIVFKQCCTTLDELDEQEELIQSLADKIEEDTK